MLSMTLVIKGFSLCFPSETYLAGSLVFSCKVCLVLSISSK
jgi:hypothetical protein